MNEVQVWEFGYFGNLLSLIVSNQVLELIGADHNGELNAACWVGKVISWGGGTRAYRYTTQVAMVILKGGDFVDSSNSDDGE